MRLRQHPAGREAGSIWPRCRSLLVASPIRRLDRAACGKSQRQAAAGVVAHGARRCGRSAFEPNTRTGE